MSSQEVSHLFDSFDAVPGVTDISADSESLLARAMTGYIDVPDEVLNWCIWISGYCSVDNYGASLADQVLRFYAVTSPSHQKRLLDALMGVQLNKRLNNMFKGPGPGGRQ
jgi:hypothetical protein